MSVPHLLRPAGRDARRAADRSGAILVVNAVHEDEPFSADQREAVDP